MKLIVLALLMVFPSACTLSGNANPARYLNLAEKYAKEGQVDKAISAYHNHILERLTEKTRPSWENPFFYYLLIGDLQLAQGQVEIAEASFLMAEDNQVDKEQVDDRLRSIATYFERQNRHQDAINFLIKYRQRQPIVFDAMADRIAKELSALEEIESGYLEK